MTDNQSNTEHLHEAGIVNKEELTEDHIKAIDQLSKEEIEHLKSIGKKITNEGGNPVGIAL